MSLFAIVILSVIGSLFKGNNHMVMGTEEDPKDGAAVAGAVFGAVFIYIVCINLDKCPKALKLISS